MEAAGTILSDGTWWVTGGGNGTDDLVNRATTEKLNLDGGWSLGENLPIPLQHHNIISINSTHASQEM